ncbi:hypothetical protein JF540_26565 [Salipiger thiooxidans]|uniref:hypothetical protein n=1 Tax=Salipiger thiooxidans TaxID=282683 RepID=UPI001A900885|nr:hypothetical protein [Salipiger thiooxidans]MBN8190240.1 hypothetical protein [Salipiger thiooxidans]
MLELAEDESYLRLIWAAHVLQSHDPRNAKKYLLSGSYGPKMVGAQAGDASRIYAWELETLANELLTTKKKGAGKKRTRSLVPGNFQNIVAATNALRALENAEVRAGAPIGDVMLELSRIAHRQFPWQIGVPNIAGLYRNMYVFGQGSCANFFEEEYGISIQHFVYIGFILYTAFLSSPVIKLSYNFAKLGITELELKRALKLLSAPHAQARARAKAERRMFRNVAYKPSVLRRAPCIVFDNPEPHVLAPLPELIIDRITTGLFYDVIGSKGGGNAFGKNFEQYCFNLLDTTLPSIEWEGEFNYGTKKYPRWSPDLIGGKNRQTDFIIECKARRMPHSAQFGEGPTRHNGVEDLAKGIRQIWTFMADSRKAQTARTVSERTVGCVLALDNWGVMGMGYMPSVFAEAERQIKELDLEIADVDKCPVAIVSIAHAEITLRGSSPERFAGALRRYSDLNFRGGFLQDAQDPDPQPKDGTPPYPFADQIQNLLPWW